MQVFEVEGKIDLEWVMLIKTALDMGISKDEILAFLKEKKRGD
ncbi:anti-repressor SinI family protein [Bacillus kwashiorkori]|nr:anti-repressor SinI family protein [Bacillus kwashiorkori]